MPFNRYRHNGGRFPFILFITILKALVLGGLAMLMWNYTLPAVTGAGLLSYRQAVALWLLCRVLFGGLGSGTAGLRQGPPWSRGAWKNKWMQMTPEEREKFQQEWRNKWRKHG